MVIVAWWFVLSVAAVLAWIAAAGLRFAHTGRLVATIVFPAMLAGAGAWRTFFPSGAAIHAPGWNVVFVLLSLSAGLAGGVSVLPIWFLAEEKLGWRAR